MSDAALREAVLNALVHRDYAVGAPVQIRVYADRLKIWNPAVLPDGWTVKTLLGAHASTPFNPAIASAFFWAGEIETWGRGIQRIVDACQAAEAPKPKITHAHNDLWLEFPFARSYLELLQTGSETPVPGGISVKTSVTGSVKTLGKTPGITLGKTPRRILELLQNDPTLTVAALAGHIAKSESAVNRAIRTCQSNGHLKRVGSRKSGHWEVLP